MRDQEVEGREEVDLCSISLNVFPTATHFLKVLQTGDHVFKHKSLKEGLFLHLNHCDAYLFSV